MAWDVATWVAVLVLGPGAVVVFVAFLRDVRRLLGVSDDAPAAGSLPRGGGEGRGRT